MGPYPLLCCSNWKNLGADLDELSGSLVSVTAVADPFGNHTPEMLEDCFDFAKKFKNHYAIETGNDPKSYVSKSHLANVRRAQKEVSIERCDNPIELLDEWERLFNVLAQKHQITGIRRFSRATFEAQFKIPGLVAFIAYANQEIIGMDLWYIQDNCAQGHLVAFDKTGYSLRASYASKWAVIQYFNDKATWINLGSVASGSNSSGLDHFKKGWATTTRPSWLCGRILQPDNYHALSEGINNEGYFPAYRQGEF